MTADINDTRADEALIEREVMRTQDRIGETVHELEDKLNPHEITRSAMGEDGADLAKEALEVTRQNPLPVALIAVGAIWLLATSNSSAIRRMRERITGKGATPGHDPRLMRRAEHPAPIGPSPVGEAFDRRPL